MRWNPRKGIQFRGVWKRKRKFRLRRNMNKLALLLFCLVLGLGSAWASTGSINANDFQDPVNWCTNYGCNGAQFGTPQNWLSNGGRTGQVGLVSSQNFQNLVQGTSWNGN